ncbi:MAG TPA: hypothetical protein VFS19_04030 [Planctomycetota bacterium]|nr:hypothetical protein [Planctomycetota bacterium]
MSDDYLWNKTGSDREVESLERLLAPAALNAPRARRTRTLAWLAGAAAAALFAFGALQALHRTSTAKDPWEARADGTRELDLGRYGRVIAEPDTKVRVVRMDDTLHKLRLDRGTIHASITREARPRLFQVETPATTCIDLGCRYTLTVLPSGVSEVKVATGRVAFHDGRREVFIPEGASGRAAPGKYPSTPIHDDASPELKRAVVEFDAHPAGRRKELADAIAKQIRIRQDGLVAWHLLQDSEPAVVTAARDSLVKLTSIVECGVQRPKDIHSLREWRDCLFPDWKNWD